MCIEKIVNVYILISIDTFTQNNINKVNLIVIKFLYMNVFIHINILRCKLKAKISYLVSRRIIITAEIS